MTQQPQPPIPYEQTSDYRWTEAAFRLLESGALTASVTASDNVSSAVVEGACPRCVHRFTDRRPLTAVSNGLGESRAGVPGSGGRDLVEPAGSREPVVLDVTCSCGVAHPTGGPGTADASATGGCGVSFRIELAADRGPAGGQQ
ncbi:hypothetical protein [Streptomyces sp. TS71-3]|uniref:hypothetical protein n=1 Tax=Streptomyces sp. TS71-3 TaxID=2733862 RepID=UPI001B223E2E|nr:hypothetical protein [Streptomyces sp. TS71-3]GHJ36353.1 hypothetical protein Sm713_19620 [Streptomyces sp. TS71-3]